MSAADAPKIWVALDALERSAAPLGTAIGLARILQAELAALFVENVDLIRLAGFPHAAETRLFAPSPSPLALDEVESALRAQAAALQRQLDRAMRDLGLRWSFQTVRGRIVPQVLERAASGECIVIPGAVIATSIGLASPARDAVRQAPQRAAPPFARQVREPAPGPAAGAGEAGPAIVPSRQLWALPGGGPAGLRVLELGHRILLGSGQPGRLVMPDSPDEAARVRDWLAAHGRRDEWQESSFDELLVQRQKRGPGQGGLLLLPKPSSDAARELLERRLRRSDWPLVMV